jgi:hypothetical protein
VSTVSGLPSATVALPSGSAASDVTLSAEQQTELATAQLGGETLSALLPAPAAAEGDVLGPMEAVTPDYILSLSPEWQMLAAGRPSAPAADLPSAEPADGGVSFLA